MSSQNQFDRSDTIDRVRDASDIVEVIGQYVTLKKRGNSYLALCPFHSEKTPSFSVSQQKQVYHCFGCGKGGNVFTFLTEHEKMTFGEALRYLARRANIELPRTKSPQGQKESEDLYRATQVALAYFRESFADPRLGKEGKAYLRERELSAETIEEFQVGYAPFAWDGLIAFAAERGVPAEMLFKVGLVARKDATAYSGGSRYYDLFRRRVVFPIFNLSNAPIAFGGRVINTEDQPKYLNSPEHPLYQKGKTLFGLNLSKEEIRSTGKAVVVEGYLDLISVYQVGIKNVVAPLGTAFTPDQARLLARFASEAILFFDPDAAGQSAVLRSIEHLIDQGFSVRVALLPAGEDPDTFARKHGQSWIQEVLQEAVGFLEYKKSRLEADFTTLSFSRKEEVLQDLALLASRVADPARRNLFLSEAGDTFGVELAVLLGYVKKLRRQSARPPVSRPEAEKAPRAAPHPGDSRERELLGLVFASADVLKDAAGFMHRSDWQNPALADLFELAVKHFHQEGKVSLSGLLDSAGVEEKRQVLVKLSDWEAPDAELSWQMWQDHRKLVLKRRREEQIRLLSGQIEVAQKQGHEEEAVRLTRKLREVSQTSAQ